MLLHDYYLFIWLSYIYILQLKSQILLISYFLINFIRSFLSIYHLYPFTCRIFCEHLTHTLSLYAPCLGQALDRALGGCRRIERRQDSWARIAWLPRGGVMTEKSRTCLLVCLACGSKRAFCSVLFTFKSTRCAQFAASILLYIRSPVIIVFVCHCQHRSWLRQSGKLRRKRRRRKRLKRQRKRPPRRPVQAGLIKLLR